MAVVLPRILIWVLLFQHFLCLLLFLSSHGDVLVVSVIGVLSVFQDTYRVDARLLAVKAVPFSDPRGIGHEQRYGSIIVRGCVLLPVLLAIYAGAGSSEFWPLTFREYQSASHAGTKIFFFGTVWDRLIDVHIFQILYILDDSISVSLLLLGSPLKHVTVSAIIVVVNSKVNTSSSLLLHLLVFIIIYFSQIPYLWGFGVLGFWGFVFLYSS